MSTKTTAPDPLDQLEADAPRREVKILIIGGGYSGIGAAIRLRRQGITDFTLLEKAHKLGGTWRENTYPDCGADTPSLIYSFSYARNAEWDRVFAKQPQIEEYLDRMAAENGVLPHCRFNVGAEHARWNDEIARWEIETSEGTYVAKYVIAATGPMHEAAFPELPGVHDFKGAAFHSSKWDHDVDLTDKRVAVIGTGASAIQFVPKIQPQVGKLDLYQRTAPWVLPKMDRPLSEKHKQRLRRFPAIHRAIAHVVYLGSEGLQRAQRHPNVMRQIQKLGTRHMRAQVKDPQLRKQFTPNFVLGCKRMLFSNSWYPAITATNAEVIPKGVAEVTATGLVDTDGEHREVDVIIYGTGFRVTDPDISHRITGRDGQLLSELWQGSPQAYFSTVVSGYPNAFVMLGPNVGNGHGSVSTLVEMQADYIANAIDTAEQAGIETLDVKQRVQDVYNAEMQDALQGTVFNAGGCSSYYLDVNGRNSSIYPWTTLKFRKDTATFKLDDYETTVAQPATAPAGAVA
ncbi:MAG: flavin-containing monooxygenase [Solirubrobacterales bacterium]